MSADPEELPIVTFGPIDPAQPTPDWRDTPDDIPHDVLVMLLGFDPDKVDDEGNDLSEVPK
jgi:hypothetical protein